jgi:hypothetical protein
MVREFMGYLAVLFAGIFFISRKIKGGLLDHLAVCMCPPLMFLFSVRSLQCQRKVADLLFPELSLSHIHTYIRNNKAAHTRLEDCFVLLCSGLRENTQMEHLKITNNERQTRPLVKEGRP